MTYLCVHCGKEFKDFDNDYWNSGHDCLLEKILKEYEN